MTDQIGIFGIDAQELTLVGLRAAVEAHAGLGWLGGASDAASAARSSGFSDAGVIVFGVRRAEEVEAVGTVRAASARARIVVLGARTSALAVDWAARHGAAGFVSKDDPVDAIMAALKRAASGGAFALGPAAQGVCGLEELKPGETNGAMSRLSALTPREMDVLRLIAAGLTRAAIAEALKRSAKTVDTHRTAIMDKLDIHDRGELIRFAIREGVADA